MWPFSSKEPAAPAAPAAADVRDATAPPATENSPTEYLRSHSFETPSAAAAPPAEAPTAAGLLRNTALDPARLHPFADIKDDLEYLDIEDDRPNQIAGARTALPSRGWSDDLCYGTGTTYLGGLLVGSMMGLREGLTRPLGIESPTFRLRMNAVLNQVTRRGTFIGNSAGVIALTYNIFDATIDAVRGVHDIYGSVASGAIAGALFRCTCTYALLTPSRPTRNGRVKLDHDGRRGDVDAREAGLPIAAYRTRERSLSPKSVVGAGAKRLEEGNRRRVSQAARRRHALAAPARHALPGRNDAPHPGAHWQRRWRERASPAVPRTTRRRSAGAGSSTRWSRALRTRRSRKVRARADAALIVGTALASLAVALLDVKVFLPLHVHPHLSVYHQVCARRADAVLATCDVPLGIYQQLRAAPRRASLPLCRARRRARARHAQDGRPGTPRCRAARRMLGRLGRSVCGCHRALARGRARRRADR